ncbi:MAG: right-handed parallel beta-helix repeat-containing protein [Candidatus Nanoarchaeia archaeon]|nr:right-handed parallel beta-helix repeat-containing protein [Candidatus Nanoarchaeia archaeon]
MKKNIFLMSLLFALSLSLVSAATTYQVDNRNLGGNVCSDLGNETYFCTIQAAVNYSSNGDTINVLGGTYSEQIIINKNLKLKNTGDAKINAPDSRKTFTFTESTSTWDPIIIAYGGSEISGAISGNDVVNVDIEGFEIDGLDKTPSGRYVGILYRNVKGNVKENTIGHMKLDGYETFGVSVYGKSDVVVEGNDISGYSRGGIGINGDLGTNPDPKAMVKNNKVSGPGLGVPVTWAANGIQFGYGTTGTIESNEVIGSGWLGDEWSGTGILVVDCDGVNIISNKVYSNEQAIGVGEFYVSASNIEITGNEIYDNEWGISIFNDIEDVIVTDNKILNSVYDGIDVYSYGLTSWRDYTGHYPSKVKINFNEIIGNGPDALWVEVPANETIDAKNNYWGVCDGPSGIGPGTGDNINVVSGNVDYTPWLGVCIDHQSIEDNCVLEVEDVEFKTNLSSVDSCSTPSVWLQTDSKNYTASKQSGFYVATIPGSDLVGGSTVSWKFVVEDCEDHLDEGAIQSFYVNQLTVLTVNPEDADGQNGWYVTEPLFTLNNPSNSTAVISYRWDGLGPFVYNGTEFGVADAPNDGDGYLELTYWSNICGGEPEQVKELNVDRLVPTISDVYPEESSMISTINPKISAFIDKQQHQTNSQINVSSIILTVDGTVINEFEYSSNIRKINYNSNLTEGFHEVKLEVSDLAGNKGEKIWNFTINTNPVELRILNPPEGILNSKRQLLNISLGEKVKSLGYTDSIDSTPTYKNLCRNCDHYDKMKAFSEGQHNLTVTAVSYSGAEFNQSVSFFIDSIAPKIPYTTPKGGTFGNGNFTVRYTEENPVEVNLYYDYNQTGVFQKVTKTDCPAGKNKDCTFVVEGVMNEKLDYYFEIIDISGFNTTSKVITTTMDTIPPVMTKLGSPLKETNYTKKVPFDIEVSEPVDIYYKDNKGKNPDRWTRLASKVTEYKKSVSFSKGPHEVEIKIIDKAGNTEITDPINFEVI